MQIHLFPTWPSYRNISSVSRPHQRGWMGGNKESICCSPQEPSAKPCLTKRRLAKRVKQLFSDTFSWTFHGQYVLVAFFSLCLHLTIHLTKCFHTFTNPSVCHPNQTLSSKHSLIGQNRLFGSRGSASPQNVPPLFYHSKDWEDFSGLWAQGGGARLASLREETICLKNQRVIRGAVSDADSLEQLDSLNQRSSVWKTRRFVAVNMCISDRFCSWKAEEILYLHFICCPSYLLAKVHRNPTRQYTVSVRIIQTGRAEYKPFQKPDGVLGYPRLLHSACVRYLATDYR